MEEKSSSLCSRGEEEQDKQPVDDAEELESESPTTSVQMLDEVLMPSTSHEGNRDDHRYVVKATPMSATQEVEEIIQV